MTDSEISIHQGLIDAVFDSTTSDTSTNGINAFCLNIRCSQMGFFNLLENIISTRLPSNSLINLEDTTNNGYYTARARRMSPRTQIDWTLDSSSILIPSIGHGHIFKLKI